MSFVKPRHQVMRLYGNVDDPDVYGPESFPVGGDFIIVATELPMTTPGSVTVPSATPSLNFNLPAGSSLAASIGGQAIALGNETTAFGDIVASMKNLGIATVGTGHAHFTAAAETYDGTAPVVAAGTFADISGADFVWILNSRETLRDANSAVAVSDTKYFAIDIHGWTPPNGAVTYEATQQTSLALPYLTQPLNLDILGNIAAVTVGATSTGPNSLADTLTQAFAIQNQMSAIVGHATVVA